MSTFVNTRAEELELKQEDAKKPLKIEVTAADIKRAKVKNAKCCAFACAVKRQIPGVTAAYFFRSAAWVEYADKMVRYHLPLAVQKEIVSFDRSHVMEPGSYVLSKSSKTLGQPHAPPKKGKAAAESRKRRKVQTRTKGVRGLMEPGESD